MKDFFEKLILEWWGITFIAIIVAGVWVLLSAVFYRQFFKRFYDILLSGVALIVLSPVLIFLTIFGAIKMKGNPFFLQFRPGKIDKKTGQEKIFKLIKFRTMTCEKDESGNFLPDEKRLTKYGKILRATSLDELPELINIFMGNMSIVGPRPQLVRDMVFMSDAQRLRHQIRPGLTGLAQVNGRNNVTWEMKFEYDLQYIQKVTLWKDIALIFRTLFKVLKRSDVERDGTVSDIDFGDWKLQNGEITHGEYIAKQKEAKALLPQ